MTPRHLKHVTVGGTFDHLHAGHKALIKHAFEVSERVSLALTTDRYIKQKPHAYALQTYNQRRRELEAFLTEQKLQKRALIKPISSAVGFADLDHTLDGIIVTKETRQTAVKINAIRKKNGLRPLEIVTVNLVKSSNNLIISSTKIRAGEIDRQGFVYGKLFGQRKSLPQLLRSELRQPIGKLIKNSAHNYLATARKTVAYIRSHKAPLVISVGDVITHSLIEAGYKPQIMIVDHKTRRRKFKKLAERATHVVANPAGTITKHAVNVLKSSISQSVGSKKQIVIDVKGEEDLLALPAFILSPIGALVLYGQFDAGVVVVEVTEEVKNRITDLLSRFKTS